LVSELPDIALHVFELYNELLRSGFVQFKGTNWCILEMEIILPSELGASGGDGCVKFLLSALALSVALLAVCQRASKWVVESSS
jgi:hypothetical protein